MGKHTSGKRISIRAPGRRKFKPGPKKSSGKISSVRALARRKIKPGPKKKITEEQIEKMIRTCVLTCGPGITEIRKTSKTNSQSTIHNSQFIIHNSQLIYKYLYVYLYVHITTPCNRINRLWAQLLWQVRMRIHTYIYIHTIRIHFCSNRLAD